MIDVNGMPLKVTVVGLGYVGLTTAVGLASLGHDVTGVDLDAGRVEALRRGTMPMYEPGLQAGLAEHGPKIAFTATLRDALASAPQIVMIAVQTPGESGTAFVEAAAREIGRCLVAPATLVLRSTVPLGTATLIATIVSGEYGAPVAVASNPEFLVEGRAYEAFLRPDRIVIGVADGDQSTAALMRRLYAGIDAPLIVTDIATAELAKYAANAFLATQISFINEMADLAAAAGADIVSVSRILKLDPRVGERAYLSAGAGYGGSCLPKDLRALTRSAEELGVEMRIARAVIDVNEARAAHVVEKLRRTIGDLAGKRVAVWGLAFKGGTNDVRESPAIGVVRLLRAAGARLLAYDPLAEPNAGPLVGADVLCDGLYTPLENADALVVLTDCAEFACADFGEMKSRMAANVIVDGRGIVPAGAARAAGFTYIGVGDRGTDAGEMARATRAGKVGRA